MIAKQGGGRVSEIIGIEGRPYREPENLAGVRILHHHRAVQRMVLFHRVVQRALRHELNVLVDGQHQVVARQWLMRFAAQHMPFRVECSQHASRRAVQIIVEVPLQAAEPVVVGADIAQHLRQQSRCWDRNA